jgi:hypothetical protein
MAARDTSQASLEIFSKSRDFPLSAIRSPVSSPLRASTPIAKIFKT